MVQAFVDQLTDFLNKHDTLGATKFLEKNREFTENNLNNVISAIVPNITSSTLKYEPKKFKCLSSVLMFVAINYDPKIIILEIQEHVKYASDHINFRASSDAMYTCLKTIEKKATVIDWCLDSFKGYIRNLPLPDEVDDPETACDEILHSYETITLFLKQLVPEVIDIISKQEKEFILKCLLNFLIFLCGKPFCYLHKFISEETMYKKLVDSIVTQTFYLTEDVLYFLDIVSQREKQSTSKISHIEPQRHIDDICSMNVNSKIHDISNIAYANFYFYIITEENYWKNVPQVYNSYYILETCAYFIKILLSEDYTISNGLIFMENVIKRIPSCSVDSKVLDLDIYTEVFQPIIKITTYSDSKEERQKALSIFQKYIEIYNMEARYTIILYLYEIVEHSGLLSFVISMFKSFIIQCIESTPQNSQFLGKNMELLLKKICSLPHGSLSDVVEVSDVVITTLNLLRFLFIRDKNNETGIWNMTDMLVNDYLNPLREGIDLCRAHWRVKTKDLEQQKKDSAKEQDYSKLIKANMEVTLTVGGEQLPVMPISEKISTCYRVLNGLDVMESVLIRVNECINEKYVESLINVE